MTDVHLDETGTITVICGFIHGVGVLTEAFYPLCGDAVQTEVLAGSASISIRPDCYTKRSVIKQHEVNHD